MATQEQKDASGLVRDAVQALNAALSAASSVGLHVELTTRHLIGQINPVYLVEAVEIRETVMPSPD